MKTGRFLVLFIILFLAQNSAFAFFDIPNDVLKSVTIQNKNKKIYSKNLRYFGCFLDIQGEFPCEARFVAPITTQNPSKNLRLIATSLYFNILKNEKLMELQKEKITLLKELLDTQRNYQNRAGICEASGLYTQAQIEYLAYKKATRLLKKQLTMWGNTSTATDKNLDDFDMTKLIDMTAKPGFTSEQEAIADHLQYEYLKAKNLDNRIQKQSKIESPKDCISRAESKYDLIELKKELTVTKLRCIIYYFSLKETLY